MAKIVLYDGTNGARRKIIARLKSELTHVFFAKSFGTINLNSFLTNEDRVSLSSDGTSKVVELTFNSDSTRYITNSSIGNMDDRKITNFYMVGGGSSYSRFVFGRKAVDEPEGTILVTAIMTVYPQSPTVDSAFFVNQFKIEVLDQA